MAKKSYIIDKPVLLDKAIGELQNNLLGGISWLNNAYGVAQRVVKEIKGVEYALPVVYMGRKGYLEVSPDQGLGNYCFFFLDDPIECSFDNTIGEIEVDCSIIFWFDYRTIFSNKRDYMNLEQVKLDILSVLRESSLSNGNFTIERLYSQSKNIYTDFSIKELDNQYHMHPFGGLRIDGTLKLEQLCF